MPQLLRADVGGLAYYGSWESVALEGKMVLREIFLI